MKWFEWKMLEPCKTSSQLPGCEGVDDCNSWVEDPLDEYYSDKYDINLTKFSSRNRTKKHDKLRQLRQSLKSLVKPNDTLENMSGFCDKNSEVYYRFNIKRNYMRKEAKKAHIKYENSCRRKQNIEKNLVKLGLTRLNPNYLAIKERLTLEKEHGKYVLTSYDNCNLGLESAEMQFLIDLQFRDIDPTDYDYLLLLDDKVDVKVMDNERVEKMPKLFGQKGDCVIYFDEIIEDLEIIKLFKCNHIFHKDCIKKWLTTVSNKCPIDGSVL